MRSTKKIIFILFTTLFFNCKTEEKYKHIKYNLFKNNYGYLYVKQERRNFENPNEIITNYDSIVYDFKKHTSYNIKDIIDINSYEPIKNSVYFKDKKNIYSFSATPLYFPSFNIININPNKYNVLGNYINDGKKIFFFSSELKADTKTFKTIFLKDTVDNSKYYYGIDKKKHLLE